jgi:hypothetical protein
MNAIKYVASVSKEGSIEITDLDLEEGTLVEVILLISDDFEDEEHDVELAQEEYKNGDFITLEEYHAQRCK